jgi:hypothetical protein
LRGVRRIHALSTTIDENAMDFGRELRERQSLRPTVEMVPCHKTLPR